MTNIDMVGTAYGQGITVTDPRWTPTDVANPVTAAMFTATQDIRTLDAWLTTNNAAYWTATRLAQESIWDKLFFLRSSIANNAGLS
jgi:hypothetical protein